MSSQNLAISPETFPKSSHKTRNVWIGIGVSAIIIVTIILGLTLSKDQTPTPSPVCFLSKLLDVSTDSTGEVNHYLSLGVIVPSGIMKKDSFVYITLTSILTSGIQQMKLLTSQGVQMTEYSASAVLNSDLSTTSTFMVTYDVDKNVFIGGTTVTEFTCSPQTDVLSFLDVSPSEKNENALSTGPVCFLSSADSNAVTYAVCLPSGVPPTKAFLVMITRKSPQTQYMFHPYALTLARDELGVLQCTLPEISMIVSYDPNATEFIIKDRNGTTTHCQLQDNVLEFLKLYSYPATSYTVNIHGMKKTFHRIQPICDDWKKILSTLF